MDGYVAPGEPFEVKLQLRSFAGNLKPTALVAHGATVRQGEPLIAFDTAEIDDAVLGAASELEVAKANLAKAEQDVALGDRADAAGLEEKTDAVHDADTALDFWKRQDGPNFLKQLDLQLKSGQASVDDQNDELNQLRQMYQSESLTNATSDIVVKRAVRQLEMTQASFEIQKAEGQKQRETTYVDKQQEVERGVTNAHRALDEFNAQMAQQKAQRAAALTQARIALRTAQRKLSDLEQDKAALVVNAPHDGVAYFGAFADGQWQNAKPDALKIGTKVQADQPLLTLVRPGKVRVVAKASDEQVTKLKVGGTVRVNIDAAGEQGVDGTVASIAALPVADGTFEVSIDLAGGDAKLVPGMKAKVEVAQ